MPTPTNLSYSLRIVQVLYHYDQFPINYYFSNKIVFAFFQIANCSSAPCHETNQSQLPRKWKLYVSWALIGRMQCGNGALDQWNRANQLSFGLAFLTMSPAITRHKVINIRKSGPASFDQEKDSIMPCATCVVVICNAASHMLQNFSQRNTAASDNCVIRVLYML